MNLKFWKKQQVSSDPCLDIIDDRFLRFYSICSEYTMTSKERMFALYESVNYVLDNEIPGDFVECGVWKGGSSIMVGLILKERGITDRKLYLYDTFDGMSAPDQNDEDHSGVSAQAHLDANKKEDQTSVWCYSGIDEVKSNCEKLGIDSSNLKFVQGKVEDTIPQTIPTNICLLRLDTDWYESTKHELDHLYPILSEKGVLIIDDYGHWKGCRKAVDEYFAKHKVKGLMNRIDYTGRLMIK